MTDKKIITANDVFDVLDSPFNNDSQRIKYISENYKNMSIAKAFALFYNLELSNETKSNRAINTVNNLEVGKVYSGNVSSISKAGIVFDVPGVKEEIISRENFAGCMDYIQQYLATHENKLLFEVREKTRTQFVVSVTNAYYKAWVNIIEKAIDHEDAIEVHIDELVKGGYVCHTNITTLCELTGRNYTSSVFIPGSHIVLNIEHDFEKWVGEDVKIVPQKFVDFRIDTKTGLVENSLVGSRKRVLQIMGMQNMYDIWQQYETAKKLSELTQNDIVSESLDGVVTGIINSNKKTGIFVELIGKYITGLMPVDPIDLLDYKPGDEIKVRIIEFEVQEGKEPFVFNKKKQLIKCNVRPVFDLA